MDRFSEVQADAWRDSAAVCIAGGPSLTESQVGAVRAAHEKGACRVIAVNDAYRLAPFADLLFFADSKWWEWHREKPEFKAFAGQKCTIQSTGAMVGDDEIHMLRNGGREGISRDSAELRTGGNSGHCALNIAAMAGAAHIALLGYDARQGENRKKHWFGDHPDGTAPTYREMIALMRTTAAPLAERGIEVLNASPGSALDCFPRATIEEFLARL